MSEVNEILLGFAFFGASNIFLWHVCRIRMKKGKGRHRVTQFDTVALYTHLIVGLLFFLVGIVFFVANLLITHQ